MKQLDDANLWSEEQGKLYHYLMHAPEQVWKAGYEPKTQGEPRQADGALLVGRGVGLFAARLAQQTFPITCSIRVSTEPAVLPDRWITIQILEPGETGVSSHADAAVAPLGTPLDSSLPVAFYDNTLPRAACLGSMLFSLASLLQQCGLLDDAEATARPVVGMLMQKAGAVAVGLESELNMAKGMAAALHGGTPVFIPLSAELEIIAVWARMQMNRLTGLPAVSLTASDARDSEILAAYSGDNWRPILLSRMDASGLPARRDDTPEALASAQTLYAEGENDLEAFFSLVYPLTLVAFYMSILRGIVAS